MINAFLRRSRAPLLGIGCLVTIACIISTTTRGWLLDNPRAYGTWVKTPVKAHLVDGGVIVFIGGAWVDTVRVTGDGRRFDALRNGSTDSRGISLDSVVGFEVYQRQVNPFRTLVYGTVTLAASVIGTVAVGAILFGSCPTIYGDSAGVQTLQAESFSYSARLLSWMKPEPN